MGDYAEMMLDGTCCCSCGEFLDDPDLCGPSYCASCQPQNDPELIFAKVKQIKKPKQKKTVKCWHPGCNKFFVDKNAVKQHLHHFHKVRGVFDGN